jgi:predicted RNase H-like nuclease (RuvC/YqgF family)
MSRTNGRNTKNQLTRAEAKVRWLQRRVSTLELIVDTARKTNEQLANTCNDLNKRLRDLKLL